MDIAKSEFMASLRRLESMAKGGATQLHHTPSDSDPGSWAGTSTKDGQNEHEDGIDDNGTDYNGVKKALARKVESERALTKAEVAIVKGQDPRPAIMAKIQKGQKLTAAESWALKGGVAKMGLVKGNDKPSDAIPTPGEAKDATSVPDTHGGESEQDEIEHDAKKSLDGAVAQSNTLRKGLEMSPILVEFTRAMGEALKGVEARTVQHVQKSLIACMEPLFDRIGQIEKSMQSQGEFNKSFSEAIVGIGQHMVGGTEVAAQAASLPAGPPRSQLRSVSQPQQGQGQVQPVQKSFGPGGLDTGSQSLQKSQIVDVMCELVEKGKLNSLDVVKFETSNELNPATQQLIHQHIAGGVA